MKYKGDQKIIIGDINEYILSHNIRRFMVNLGLIKLQPIKMEEKGQGKKDQTRRSRQSMVFGPHKAL